MPRDMTDKMTALLLRLAKTELSTFLTGGDLQTANSLIRRGLASRSARASSRHWVYATNKGRQLAREILAKREGTS
jgi:hypothetical protein